MADENVKENVEDGEEEETIEGEEEFVEEVADKEEIEEQEEEEEGEEEEEEKRGKKRRCQKRRRIRQIYYDDEDEDGEEEEGGEDLESVAESEDNIGGSEESENISFTSSVLSAITFEWEEETYEFEELCDFGTVAVVYRPVLPEAESVDELGLARYFEMCDALNIYPMTRIARSLGCEVIDLSNCNVDSKNIKAMCAALEMNNTVKRLIMRHNKLKLEDCSCLGNMLKSNETLTHMDFTGCRMGPEGLELLIAYLPKNESLEDFNLSKCNIQDEGMRMLALMLKENNSILTLDLSYNNLEEESGEALAYAFKYNHSVTNLILRYNKLFFPNSKFFCLVGSLDRETIHDSQVLGNNEAISCLDLSWNALSGTELGNSIGNFLKKSPGIRYLDLSDNRFQGAAVLELKKGLSKARALETLKLGRNPLSPEDMTVLVNAVKGVGTLTDLDFEELWVDKAFQKVLSKVRQNREINVKYAGVLSNYEVFGPDYSEILFRRAQFEAQKPKQAKKKRDFGHLIWTLGDEPITTDDFMEKVKKFKAKVSKELIAELMREYLNQRTMLVDVVTMRQKYLKIFPDSTPPPPPPPKKGKKGKEEEVVVEEQKGEAAGGTAEGAVEGAAEGAAEGGAEDLGGEEGEEDEEGELMIDGFEEDKEEMVGFEEADQEVVLEAGNEEAAEEAVNE